MQTRPRWSVLLLIMVGSLWSAGAPALTSHPSSQGASRMGTCHLACGTGSDPENVRFLLKYPQSLESMIIIRSCTW
eukprot:5864981-Heterocapsa_arctica.AAC.1